MAKFKKASKKSPRPSSRKAGASKADARAQAERLSKSLSESAQQIWQAGVGAFGRAQDEGSKLFEGLVKEGLNLEQSARKFAGARAEVVRDKVDAGVGQARDRATDTWDRLEKVFEDRVQRALNRLGVPGRDDLGELNERVDALSGALRRSGVAVAPATKKATKKAAKKAAKKTGAKKAAKKVVAKKAAKKTARKAVAKKAAPAKAAAKRTTAPKPAAKKAARKPAAPTKATKAAHPRKSAAKPIITTPAAPVAPTAAED